MVSNPSNAGHVRTVMTIIIIALVLVPALAAVVIVTKKRAVMSQPDGTTANMAPLAGYAGPTEYPQGKGLWFKRGELLSDEEIASEAAKGTKISGYYFDYTCNIRNDMDGKLNRGKQLEDLAEGGKALLVLCLILIHNVPFVHVADNLICWVAKNQPEKMWELSKALTRYTMNTHRTADFQNNKNNSKWIDEATNPKPVVERIAEENGIDYSQVSAASSKSGQISIDIYAKQRMAKLSRNSAGAPLYIADGKILKLGGVKLSDKLLESTTLQSKPDRWGTLTYPNGNFAQFRDSPSKLAFKHERTGDDDIRLCFNYLGDILVADTAIYLDASAQLGFLCHLV